MSDKVEAVLLQHELIRELAPIADGGPARVLPASAAHIGGPRRGGLGEDLLAGIDDVVERGLNDIGQRILFQHLNHAQLLTCLLLALFTDSLHRDDAFVLGGIENDHALS